MEGLSVTLDHAPDGRVEHGGLLLDTLWHAMSPRSVVTSDLYAVSETLSLVRDTKHIDVVLREIDDPAGVDVADYDFRITDRNLRLRYDNSVDESGRQSIRPTSRGTPRTVPGAKLRRASDAWRMSVS